MLTPGEAMKPDEQPVEVGPLPGADRIAVRRSEEPEGPVLVYPAKAWADFVAGAKDGEFDLDVLASRVR